MGNENRPIRRKKKHTHSHNISNKQTNEDKKKMMQTICIILNYVHKFENVTNLVVMCVRHTDVEGLA